MDKLILKLQKKISNKSILIMAIISLVMFISYSIIIFCNLEYDWLWQEYLLYYHNPFVIMLPTIMLIVYSTILHKYYKAFWIIPVIYGLTVGAIFQTFLRRLGLNLFSSFLFAGLLFSILFLIIFIFKGLMKKTFILIMLLCVIHYTYVAIDYIQFLIVVYFEFGNSIYDYGILIYYLGYILLYISLLIFTIKSNIPALVKKKATIEELSLQQLKEKYEHGEISEEEYKRKRAEIISNL